MKEKTITILFFFPQHQALEIDKNSAKAFWRLGQAFTALESWSLARVNLFKAAKIEPQQRDIRKDLDFVQKKLEEQTQLQQKQQSEAGNSLFKGIFSNNAKK